MQVSKFEEIYSIHMSLMTPAHRGPLNSGARHFVERHFVYYDYDQL